MNRNRLNKIRRELAQARRSPQRAADVESLAKRLGRKRNTKRGKEPVWESQRFPYLFPLAIPHHGGRDLPIGTKNNILDQLESDVNEWDALLEDNDDDTEEGDDGTQNGDAS